MGDLKRYRRDVGNNLEGREGEREEGRKGERERGKEGEGKEERKGSVIYHCISI